MLKLNMFRKEILFIPLGGGQRVGASCYFLKYENANIILDAGSSFIDNIKLAPDFFFLESIVLHSLKQITHIFISHAHTDHIGSLLNLLELAPNASVYMTAMTKILVEYQLTNERKSQSSNKKFLLDRITEVCFFEELIFSNFSVSFLPAGHIPGAMMSLFDFNGYKVLYTGDYSLNSTELTQCCIYPDEKVDVLIMCALHAKHSYYKNKDDALEKLVKEMLTDIENHQSVFCYSAQLSKALETLSKINLMNINKYPIYIDDTLYPLIQKIESQGIPLVKENCYSMNHKTLEIPHIYLSGKRTLFVNKNYKNKVIRFSLHEDFDQLRTFIKKINAKHVYLVHCDENHETSKTIEQYIMTDADCFTQFTFAEEREVYKI